jgi:hypothetical protein
MKCDEHEGQWMEAEQDDLVRRLRGLEWPSAPDTVKRRCWEDLSRHLELGGDAERRVPERSRRNIGERYDYSRRALAARGPADGSRLAARRAWARPARALSLA